VKTRLRRLGPDYVLTTSRHLSAEQADRIMARWRDEYDGRLIILGPGMTIRSFVPTLRELLEQRTVAMTSQRWLEVPVEYVAVAELLPIQPEPIVLLWEPMPRADSAVHVVEHDGRLYVQDGHHRLARARCAGNPWVLARVLRAG
jgi:hypothetical protein